MMETQSLIPKWFKCHFELKQLYVILCIDTSRPVGCASVWCGVGVCMGLYALTDKHLFY